MRLFDTMTQRLQTLHPLGDDVTLYVCGITPYDTTHLGHAFINVVYDTLVRALRWQGQPVRYAQNVTDIDDDILRKAREVGKPWDVLGREETARYRDDLRALNVAPPTYYIRATEEIGAMLALIEALLREGLAYEREGWVYYAVGRDAEFGKLAEAAGYHGYAAWLATANERGNDPRDPRKRDPLDFVLWQAARPGEPSWPSPWRPGRPGWHIECSAMAVKYLGPRIDLHGGGADLIFPHHTCEIAQSERATGQRPFVGIWMHCAMVRLDGEKMSKSLGNLVLVRDLLRRYSPDAVRVLLLSHHYREPWEYREHDMERAARQATALAAAAARLRDGAPAAEAAAAGGDDAPAAEAAAAGGDDALAAEAHAAVRGALESDLDTPGALLALSRLAERAVGSGDRAALATLVELAGVLGLRLGLAEPSSAAAGVRADNQPVW